MAYFKNISNCYADNAKDVNICIVQYVNNEYNKVKIRYNVNDIVDILTLKIQKCVLISFLINKPLQG